MGSVYRGVRWLVTSAVLSLVAWMLYVAFFAQVPTARVVFRLPVGTGGEVHTPLEPMAPGAQASLCETQGTEWSCNVRQTFWQNPLSDHKTGHLVLSLHDTRNCHRQGLAPSHVTVPDHPEITVETVPLPTDGCSTRWDLRVRW